MSPNGRPVRPCRRMACNVGSGDARLNSVGVWRRRSDTHLVIMAVRASLGSVGVMPLDQTRLARSGPWAYRNASGWMGQGVSGG